MEEELVSIETAKLAKEKGFNYKSEYYLFPNDNRDGYNLIHKNHYFPNFQNTLEVDYFNDYYSLVIPRPTQSLLQRWLREVYNIHVVCNLFLTDQNEKDPNYITFCYNLNDNSLLEDYIDSFFDYEKGLEIGLQEALKLIK